MKRIGMFFGFVILVLATVSAFSIAVMLLWNWLLPTILGVAIINFWQALGILTLSKILFGGFGFQNHHKKFNYNRSNALREKWQQMSEEERREFLKHRNRFGFGHDFFKQENEKDEENK